MSSLHTFDDCPTEGLSCTQHSFLSSLSNKCRLHALLLKWEGVLCLLSLKICKTSNEANEPIRVRELTETIS